MTSRGRWRSRERERSPTSSGRWSRARKSYAKRPTRNALRETLVELGELAREAFFLHLAELGRVQRVERDDHANLVARRDEVDGDVGLVGGDAGEEVHHVPDHQALARLELGEAGADLVRGPAHLFHRSDG